MSIGGGQGRIEVDWRPVWWSFAWAWVLIWIPTAALAMRVKNTTFNLGDGALTIRTGALSKTTEHVELYRVKNVSASENVVAGGKVTLDMQDGSQHVVQPIRNADTVATSIRAAVNAAKTTQGVQRREDI